MNFKTWFAFVRSAWMFFVIVVKSGVDMYVHFIRDKIDHAHESVQRGHFAETQTKWGHQVFVGLERIMKMPVDFRLPNCWQPQPVLYLLVHKSLVDIPRDWSLAWRMGTRNMRWVMKKSIRHYPILGWACFKSGCAFVTRKDRGRDKEIMKIFAETTRNDNASIYLYVEGTRSDTSGKEAGFQHLGRPKAGGFIALREALPDLPVVIVVSRGLHFNATNRKIFGTGNFFGKRWTVDASWFIPAAEVLPTKEWLNDIWKKLDQSLDTES